MSKKLQCQNCGRAECGEDLYNYDGEILCRYCIVARVYEGSIPCEYVGTCNDKTYPNKTEQIDQLKQQLEEEKVKVLDLKKRLRGSTKELDKMLNDILHNENKRLIQQLVKKDKEIKNLNHKLNAEEPCLIRNYKDMIEQLKQSQAQLAITELEKVKMLTEWKFNSIADVVNQIDQQIKELSNNTFKSEQK